MPNNAALDVTPSSSMMLPSEQAVDAMRSAALDSLARQFFDWQQH